MLPRWRTPVCRGRREDRRGRGRGVGPAARHSFRRLDTAWIVPCLVRCRCAFPHNAGRHFGRASIPVEVRRSLTSLGDSAMRNSIPIVFVAVTVLVGCQSPSLVHTQTAAPTVAAPPPFRSMLMTTFGTHTTPDGTWRVSVSEASLDLSRAQAFSDGKGSTSSGWSTIRPQGWRAHAGWFVFTESESRAWAYDGDRLLFLDTETSSGNSSWGATYCNSGFPCAVPAEVFSRLSEPAQKAIQMDR